MDADKRLRMEVYAEGRRAAADAACPYTDWRAGTWAKGRESARVELERDIAREQAVPCNLCGTPTTMLGTKLCDPCWELSRRIERRPDLARLILDKLDAEGS